MPGSKSLPGLPSFTTLTILAHRKKTENKKCKILDKRCFNVQRHHPKSAISPTRPENVPKCKGFCIDFRSSRRHSMSLHSELQTEAPFVKNFTFFIFGFFPMSQYSERGEAREARERFRARQLCGNRLSTIVNFIFPISTFLDTRSRISPTTSCLSNAHRAGRREWDASRVSVNRFLTRTHALDHLKVNPNRFDDFHFSVKNHYF